MNEITHSENAGRITAETSEYTTFAVVATAFAYDYTADYNSFPLFMSFVGSGTEVSAVAAAMRAGGKKISHPVAAQRITIEKHSLYVVSKKRIEKFGKSSPVFHAVIAHQCLQGEKIGDMLYTISDHDGSGLLDQIADKIAVPLFQQWKQYIWNEARNSQIVTRLSNSSGISIWRSDTSPEKWQKIIQSGILQKKILPMDQLMEIQNHGS